MTNQEMLNAYNGLKLFQEKEAQIYKEDGIAQFYLER